jgi:hypothetical protein
MCAASGNISFSRQSLTASIEPGTQKKTLPFRNASHSPGQNCSRTNFTIAQKPKNFAKAWQNLLKRKVKQPQLLRLKALYQFLHRR